MVPRSVGLGMLVLSLAAVPSAPAKASPKDACHRAASAPGAKVVARSAKGVVFTRGESYRGCAYKTARVHTLDICCQGQRVKVAGVFAAYTAQGTAIGDETDRIAVYDLRTGKRRAIRKLAPHSEGGGVEIETSSYISVFRVARDGSVAWIQQKFHDGGTLGPEREVRAAGGRHRWERIVDEGAIGKASLTLTDFELPVISWTNDGVKHSADVDEPFLGRCNNLKGTQVRRTGSILVVKRKSHTFDSGTEFVGQEFLGCALPSGTVTSLGISGTTYLYDNGHRVGTYGAENVTLGRSAGTYLLVELNGGSNSFTYDTGDVYNLVHGTTNSYYDYLDDQSGDPQASSPDTAPTATALSAEGVFAGLFGPDTNGAHGGVRVIGVTPAGKQQVLDEAATSDAIPVSSLAVTGRTVTWTNNGAPKSAEL